VDGAVGVERLRDATALASAAIAGAAPAALRGRIAEVGEDGRLGQVAQLRDGPEVIFGDATRLRAKWAAASRVLADLEASGASYVDVRLPGRPAAGGLPAETIVPVAPAGETSTVPPGASADAAAATATADPTATWTPPPADGTVAPVDGTVPPTTTPPAAGTVTQTGTTPPAPTTSPTPATPAPAPSAPVTDSTGAGAATAPAP
jgi:hypothetical protein